MDHHQKMAFLSEELDVILAVVLTVQIIHFVEDSKKELSKSDFIDLYYIASFVHQIQYSHL